MHCWCKFIREKWKYSLHTYRDIYTYIYIRLFCSAASAKSLHLIQLKDEKYDFSIFKWSTLIHPESLKVFVLILLYEQWNSN